MVIKFSDIPEYNNGNLLRSFGHVRYLESMYNSYDHYQNLKKYWLEQWGYYKQKNKAIIEFNLETIWNLEGGYQNE